MDNNGRRRRFSIIGLFASMMVALGVVCYSVANDGDAIYATRGLGIVIKPW